MEVAVEAGSELTLMDRVRKIEETFKDAIKELKRAARDELKSRRRRRGAKREGGKKVKGETPPQLMGWHAEVRRVWEELKASDAKTPYKRAVAEAHARRSGKVAAAVPVAVVEEKKGGKKAAAVAVAKTEEVKTSAPKTEAKAEKKGKKSSA
jgi:hypothetical protein